MTTSTAGPLAGLARRLPVPSLLPLLALAACTSFSTVRSAEVHAGPSALVQGAATTPLDDDAGWFWSFDCDRECGDQVISGDAGVAYGWRPDGSARAFALAIGTSGTHPYVDGYLQLDGGRRPYGVGVRLGPPVTPWREHQLYGRLDVPMGEGRRLLLNPAVLVHEGRSPNGENPGTFVGFVQGVGLLLEGERVSWTPSLAIVTGRTRRTQGDVEIGPSWSTFGVAAVGVALHRPRGRDR